ncbi:dentin sialophosphoprotein-like protein isoform X2 [Tasmannia lanceolata]|uniref:dentin sialophosphoprotein-like protein isoform X2 n=1 Tax=Tasmannia lanceolata TaxID=3420 RepID=UPI0040644F53
MSDWGMYELEDIVWDEFGVGDDHIVPHPGSEPTTNEHITQGGFHNKPKCELANAVGRSTDSKKLVSKNVFQGKETATHYTFKDGKAQLLEKGCWSHANSNGDSNRINITTGLASESSKISDNCFKSTDVDTVVNEFCTDVPILGNRSVCPFQLDDISPEDSDLEFFGNECEGKESSDLLDYGWPDIANFEDIDRMFRNCDSTFGQGSTSTANELSWFSASSLAIDGSEDAFKLGFQEESPSKEQFNKPREQPKNQTKSEQKDRSSECLSNTSLQCQKQFWGPDSLSYFNTCTPYLVDGSPDPLSKPPDMTQEEKIEKLRQRQQIRSQFTTENELEETGMEVPTVEVDLSTVQESSCMSTVLCDEISLEATGFRKLQNVMEQLDIRTKLCIRDSLYRLAMSAEQRHHFCNTDNYVREGRGRTSGVAATKVSNKCVGIINTETDTNPIDRSIAHLLFYRPSEPAKGPANDAMSLESHIVSAFVA